jgi:hypothetical protein
MVPESAVVMLLLDSRMGTCRPILVDPTSVLAVLR